MVAVVGHVVHACQRSNVTYRSRGGGGRKYVGRREVAGAAHVDGRQEENIWGLFMRCLENVLL